MKDNLTAVKTRFDYLKQFGTSPNSPYGFSESDYSAAKSFLEKEIFNAKASLNYWLNTEATKVAGLREILEQEGFAKSVMNHITDEVVQKHGATASYAYTMAEICRGTMVFTQKLYKEEFGKEYNPTITSKPKGTRAENCLSVQEASKLL